MSDEDDKTKSMRARHVRPERGVGYYTIRRGPEDDPPPKAHELASAEDLLQLERICDHLVRYHPETRGIPADQAFFRVLREKDAEIAQLRAEVDALRALPPYNDAGGFLLRVAGGMREERQVRPLLASKRQHLAVEIDRQIEALCADGRGRERAGVVTALVRALARYAVGLDEPVVDDTAETIRQLHPGAFAQPAVPAGLASPEALAELERKVIGPIADAARDFAARVGRPTGQRGEGGEGGE